MKKQLIAATIISAILLPHTSWAVVAEPQDEREHTEELVGLSSGILLGAVIAGPVGAIIGAFTGTMIGKTVGDEAEIADKNQQLVKQEHELVETQQQLIAMDLQQQELVQVSEKYYQLQTNLA